MNAPSIRKTAAVSAALHATLFFLSLIILQHTASTELPSPYVVTLVGPGSRHATAGSSNSTGAQETGGAPERREAAVENIAASAGKKATEEKRDEKRVEDRLSELAAMSKIKRIVGLRRAIVDIKGRSGRAVSRQISKGPAGGASGGSAMGAYIDRITAQIHDRWAIPDIFDKKLSAVIAVKIMKDGQLYVLGMEKGSGSRSFDSIALKTIANASPVSPPPHEMEIGIRFYP